MSSEWTEEEAEVQRDLAAEVARRFPVLFCEPTCPYQRQDGSRCECGGLEREWRRKYDWRYRL